MNLGDTIQPITAPRSVSQTDKKQRTTIGAHLPPHSKAAFGWTVNPLVVQAGPHLQTPRWLSCNPQSQRSLKKSGREVIWTFHQLPYLRRHNTSTLYQSRMCAFLGSYTPPEI